MTLKPTIACRMVACREHLGDGKEWSLYLINDSGTPFRGVVLKRVSSEWGSMNAVEARDIFSGDIVSGGHALLWRDDGSGAEFKMSARVRLEIAGDEVTLIFDIPKLYRQRDLPVVSGLGKAGLQMMASDTAMRRLSE